jgi:drug/metabolite transporter (DMT)-like permease
MFIGEIAALATALFWSFASIFFTFGVKKVGVIQLNIDRLFFASVYLFVVIVILGIIPHITFEQIEYLMLSSIAGLVLGDTFLFKAFSEIGPRISLLLVSFAPPLSAILAYIFLGESLGSWAIVGIMTTTIGVAIVVLEKDNDSKKITIKNKMGFLWAFLGMLGQASGLIFAKVALNITEIHPLIASFTRIFSAWIMLIPIGLLTQRYKFGYKVYSVHKKSILAPTIGAILGPFLGITLSLVAITYAKVGIASTLMSTTPILMLPISHFVYKEKLHWTAYLGAFVAVLGIAILFLR